jgi:hypothetical protein
MAEPIIELIAGNIKTAINAITVANGFHYDLTAYRPIMEDFTDVAPVDGMVLLWQGEDDDVGPDTTQIQHWDQIFILEAIIRQSTGDTDALDIKANRVVADIRKKVMEDPTRGGHATDTRPQGAFKAKGDGFCIMVISIGVNYRTQLTDPYTAA